MKKISKIILICVCIFIIFSIVSPSVKASNQDVFAYTTSTYDEENRLYIIKYRRYGVTGLMEGEIKLPSDMKEEKNWSIMLRNDGVLSYFYFKSPNINQSYKFILEYGKGAYGDSCSIFGRQDASEREFYYRNYDFENETWGGDNRVRFDYSLQNYGTDKFYMPNNVITTNGVRVVVTKQLEVDYQVANKQQMFKSPHMKILVNKGFRLYLNDFFTFSDVTDDGTLLAELSALKFTSYEMNSKIYYSEAVDVLQYREVEEDSEGNKYIDLLYDDFLQYFQTTSGDYLIGIRSDLTCLYLYNGFGSLSTSYDIRLYKFKSVYQSMDFFRYKYDAETGIGELIPVDENGNPINPAEPQPTPDLTQQAIKEQTDAIKEQTEVSKNIFQQIIELPRKNN